MCGVCGRMEISSLQLPFVPARRTLAKKKSSPALPFLGSSPVSGLSVTTRQLDDFILISFFFRQTFHHQSPHCFWFFLRSPQGEIKAEDCGILSGDQRLISRCERRWRLSRYYWSISIEGDLSTNEDYESRTVPHHIATLCSVP